MNKTKRLKHIRNYKKLYIRNLTRCSNCGDFGNHYAPPSLNDKGGFIRESSKCK